MGSTPTSPDSSASEQRSSSLWRTQAIIQLVFFLLTTALIVAALIEIHSAARQGLGIRDPATPLVKAVALNLSLINRLSNALAPECRLVPIALPFGVSVWALASLLGNVAGALSLFSAVVNSMNRKRPWLSATIVVFSVVAVFISVAAAPFLMSNLEYPDSHRVPIDVSFVAAAISLVYLIVDILSCLESDSSSDKHRFLLFILSVDLPCLLTILIFWACSLFVHMPPEFGVGVTAALLTYYNLAFMFLACLFAFPRQVPEGSVA
jgi:hypothetical protein